VYRLKKVSLQQKVFESKNQLALFFIFTGKELPAYEELLSKMSMILKRLVEMEHPNNTTQD
jgi:ribonuclease P protein component